LGEPVGDPVIGGDAALLDIRRQVFVAMSESTVYYSIKIQSTHATDCTTNNLHRHSKQIGC
jgi:hypothetical protein